MYRVMYMSVSTKDFSDEELERLLVNAEKSNRERNVTGLLIIKGRTFLQCLEGKKEDVEFIYNKIQNDYRHKDIIDLIQEDASERYFPNWSMGYKNIKNLTNIKSEKLRDFSKKRKLIFHQNTYHNYFKNL